MNSVDILNQIEQLLEKSQNILIISHTSIDGDGIGSGLGLQMALTKLGKKVTFYSKHPAPEAFRFLPGINTISQEFNLNQDFTIEIDTTQTKIETVQTQEEGPKFRIIVTPKNGVLNKEDIRLLNGDKKIDLIFTLDASTLEYTGLMNGPQAELFYETPVINIDHHVTNEHYGKINFVDVTATSTAELVLNLIERLEEQVPLMDEDMATCLLSGVIVDTGSFQNANTTPRAFAVAARLLTAGARQQEIIRHLFKMHELSTLRLWGKALSHLEHDARLHLAWTTVTNEDFTQANAQENELDGLMDQLITSASDADIVFMIRECNDGSTKVSIRSIKNIDITPIVLPFNGGGHQRAAGFKITDKSFSEAKEAAIQAIQKFMEDYLTKSTNKPDESFHPVQSTLKEPQPAPQIEPEPIFTPPAPAAAVTPPATVPAQMPDIASLEPMIQTPTLNYVAEPTTTPVATTESHISYSQPITNIPPSGISNAQKAELEKAYAEPITPLPTNDFLGYKPESNPENSLLKESTIQTPQEKQIAEAQTLPGAQVANPPITLKVTTNEEKMDNNPKF